MSKEKGRGDYEVGYGRPPTRTRFKKGQSGNPMGRWPQVASVKDILTKELAKTVPIIEDGEQVRITKFELLVRSNLNEAIKGKGPAFKWAIQVIREAGLNESPETWQELDEATVQALHDRSKLWLGRHEKKRKEKEERDAMVAEYHAEMRAKTSG